MSVEKEERMLELLSDMAVFGLTDAEQAELAALEREFPELSDDSFELAAAAVSMVGLDPHEALPAHLRARLEADAEKYLAAARPAKQTPAPARREEVAPAPEEFQKTFEFEPRKAGWNWLGWAVAAVACVALAFNLYTTRGGAGGDTAKTATPTPAAMPKPAELSPAQQREQLLASAGDVVRSDWGDIDPKKPQGVEGDVVWSNAQQKGFIRFRNLPVNDKTREQYQLWIFDETQKHPVDGGVFDADAAGEIVIPIDAKIRVAKPAMFAVTAEKPGGVVVSAREKVMAVAKVAA